MAVPAVKREVRSEHARAPRLRLVRSAHGRKESRGTTSARGRACEVARCRRGFRVACAALIVLTAVAMLRVEVTVRAAEAALTTNTLRKDIESERIKSESLEARRMALAAPARIESIAGTSMGMGAANGVAYIDMPSAQTGSGETGIAESGSARATTSGRVAGLLASIMKMTAGEAQVLLVGDAGLASSR
jgi:hypothetical protein